MNILILTTGGTIAGNVAESTSKVAGLIQQEAELKDILVQLQEELTREWSVNVTFSAHEVANVDSSDITPTHWQQLAEAIKERYDDYAGFVITHGTNTMGYTTAALALALPNLGKCVAVTGSQVPFGSPGSDALMNLENAVRVVAYPFEQLRGVICVFGSMLITGARAKKVSEFEYDAFRSYHSPELGRVGRTFHLNRDALTKHHDYLEARFSRARSADKLELSASFDTRILSFTEFPGLSEKLLMALTEQAWEAQELKGVIFRAFGAGDPSASLMPWFEFLKTRKIPVVVTTQAPLGISNFDVNAGGRLLSEQHLAIPAHDMCIEAITAKMAWLLGRGTPYTSMPEAMERDYVGEINIVRERK